MAKKEKVPKNIDEKGDGKVGAIIIVLVFILIWITALALLVKFDAGGLGTTLRPYLKNVPVLNLILPNVPDEQVSWEENYPYANLGEAITKIQELEAANETLTKDNLDYSAKIAELNAEIERLKVFEENQKAFEERVKKFEQYVVFNAKAPDVTEYRAFYEEISPENAEEIYRQVLELVSYDEGINTQAKLFSEMKPGQAADTLQEMTADIEWIVKVMLAMKSSNATEIMNKMDALYVAKIMQRMSDLNEEKLQNLYQVLNTDYSE